MGVVKDIKEQRQKDKEEFYERLEFAKQHTKDTFNKDNRNAELEIKKAILTSPEIKEFTKNQYKTHMQLFMAAIPAFIVGFIFVPVMIVALGLIVGGLVCMGMNWNRINEEHKMRRQLEANIRKRLTEPKKSVVDEDYEF